VNVQGFVICLLPCVLLSFLGHRLSVSSSPSFPALSCPPFFLRFQICSPYLDVVVTYYFLPFTSPPHLSCCPDKPSLSGLSGAPVLSLTYPFFLLYCTPSWYPFCRGPCGFRLIFFPVRSTFWTFAFVCSPSCCVSTSRGTSSFPEIYPVIPYSSPFPARS